MVGPASRVRRAAALVGVSMLLATALPGCTSKAPSYRVANCTPTGLGGHSVARVWDETLLQLARQVIPNPTVNARNLFHVSAAMWDAWAAYDKTADGYFVFEKRTAGNVTAAREAAISYAAYRILLWRYGTVSDLAVASDQLGAVMASLCYRTDYVSTGGSSPAALGNRIARTVIDYGHSDGALEDDRYVDNSFRPANDPLVVAEPGTVMRDPNAWQPLSLGQQIAQNGLPIPGKVQTFVGPHWGKVRPFALTPSPTGTPFDPGPPPRLGDRVSDAAFKQAAIDVLRYSAQLDSTDGVEIDTAPDAVGNNTLGTNDGRGHVQNPATGAPYAPQPVLRADFMRAVAEYWADGPKSETPPGHWNVIANTVEDAPGFTPQLGGKGPTIDPLEWDVKTYLALNGAVHDAAIAAWGLKGRYDGGRPISMIRYMASLGQSSDPSVAAYNKQGLPLVPGLIELITKDKTASGGAMADLKGHEGKIALHAWQRDPVDPTMSRVAWILGTTWMPYQLPTFVTPSFQGFISGHSTFSRAAAEILTGITGSEYFPGGLSSWTVPAGSFRIAAGPSADVLLQWATYYDAADQAGQSRLFGGIHVQADDFTGRVVGSMCGKHAWLLAQRYYAGLGK